MAPIASHVPASLPAEYQLVLRCARTVLPSEEATHLRTLTAAGIDWPTLLRLADRHKLMPLVFTHLHRLCPQTVPAPVLQTLRARFQKNLRQMLLRATELVRIVRVLREHGIQALPLKGPVLAIYAYGNLALRQAGDLDLLIPPTAVRQTLTLLQTLGYSRTLALHPAQEAAHIRHGSEMALACETRRIKVDLHWRFTDNWYMFPLALDDVWPRLATLVMADTRVPTLAGEDMLLYLCYHGSKHHWDRLSWLCDVAALLRRHPDVDWDRLMQRATVLRNQRALTLGLQVAHRLIGSALPEPVRQYTRQDAVVPRLIRAVYHELFETPEEKTPGQAKRTRLRKLAFRLQLQASVPFKVTTCYDLLRPQAVDWQAMPLPRPLFPLYHALRPLRLVRKYLMWWR